jgi:hypothetical protein
MERAERDQPGEMDGLKEKDGGPGRDHHESDGVIWGRSWGKC